MIRLDGQHAIEVTCSDMIDGSRADFIESGSKLSCGCKASSRNGGEAAQCRDGHHSKVRAASQER
eukprot:2220278-Rhodomonas_salina.3